MPLRADFKLTDHPALAAHCSMLDCSKDGELRFYYAGTETLRRAEQEMIGRNLLDFYPKTLRQVIEFWIRTAYSFPCACISHLSGELPDGRESDLEALILPFRGPDRVAKYILTVHRQDREAVGAPTDQFLQIVSRLRLQPIDIGAGCPEPVDVTAETDFK